MTSDYESVIYSCEMIDHERLMYRDTIQPNFLGIRGKHFVFLSFSCKLELFFCYLTILEQ